MIDPGAAGRSARREYERRRAKREAQIEQRWGRLAGVVKLVSLEPATTTAWAKGATGEERLARTLGERLSDRVVVLHDRKVPGTRGNIDHLVVAPSGVWIVDAKHYAGLVERRDVGGWFKAEWRLFVGGRDRTKAVEGMRWQVDAVRTALGDGSVAIHAALCFTRAEWKLFAKPFQLQEVWCLWARKLVELIDAPGPLDPAAVDRLAHHLSERLPANR